MVWVDVSLGERELIRYSFDPTSKDFWKGYELKKEDRELWNLFWKKTVHNECIVSLVKNRTIVIGDNDWDDPIEALRYSY